MSALRGGGCHSDQPSLQCRLSSRFYMCFRGFASPAIHTAKQPRIRTSTQRPWCNTCVTLCKGGRHPVHTPRPPMTWEMPYLGSDAEKSEQPIFESLIAGIFPTKFRRSESDHTSMGYPNVSMTLSIRVQCVHVRMTQECTHYLMPDKSCDLCRLLCGVE